MFDKQDLKRYSDFINHKIYDLLVQAEAAARTNGRVIIEPFDLPIIKGLQESIHEFEKIDEQIEFQLILDQLTHGRRSTLPMAKIPRADCLRWWAA